MGHWTAAEGTPLPLGVTWVEDEQAYNFALYLRGASQGDRDLYVT